MLENQQTVKSKSNSPVGKLKKNKINQNIENTQSTEDQKSLEKTTHPTDIKQQNPLQNQISSHSESIC